MPLFLITGGAGFIGSHLADHLLGIGHRVRVLDDFSTGKAENLDPRCEMIEGDVADPDAVRRSFSGTDGCFHLAAIASTERSIRDPIGTSRVNLGGTLTILDAAATQGGKPVVYASSAAVYGEPVADPSRETDRCAPLTPYGADKLGCELHSAIVWRLHRTPNIGLRFFNVYGPRQDPSSPYSGVISRFLVAAAAGRPLTIRGDGLQVRDFVFVEDVANHLWAAMYCVRARPGSAVLNVCTGVPSSIIDLAEMVSALYGGHPGHSFAPARTGDIRRSVGSPEMAIAELGIRASTRLDAGLARCREAIAPEPRHPLASGTAAQ
jgi:UDP-glucose 4-epimerase